MIYQPKVTAKDGLNKRDKHKLGRIKKKTGNVKEVKRETSKSPQSSIIKIHLRKDDGNLHKKTSASDCASMITKEIQRRNKKAVNPKTPPKINRNHIKQTRDDRFSVKSHSTNFTIASSNIAAVARTKNLSKRRNIKPPVQEIRTVEELKQGLFNEFQKDGVFSTIEQRKEFRIPEEKKRGISNNLKGMIEGKKYPMKMQRSNLTVSTFPNLRRIPVNINKPRNLKITCETTGKITNNFKTNNKKTVDIEDTVNNEDKLTEGVLLKTPPRCKIIRNEAQMKHFNTLTLANTVSRLMRQKANVNYKSPVTETTHFQSSSKKVIPLKKTAHTNFQEYKKTVSFNEINEVKTISTSKSSLRSESSQFLSVKSEKSLIEDIKKLDIQEIHNLIDMLHTSIANLENESNYEVVNTVPNNSDSTIIDEVSQIIKISPELDTIYSSVSIKDEEKMVASKEKVTEGVTMQGVNVTSIQGKNTASTQGTNVSLIERKHISSDECAQGDLAVYQVPQVDVIKVKNHVICQTRSQEILKSYLQEAQVINDKLTKKMENFDYDEEPHHPVLDIVLRLDKLHKRLQKFLEQRTNI